jgi:hypothetical protein
VPIESKSNARASPKGPEINTPSRKDETINAKLKFSIVKFSNKE